MTTTTTTAHQFVIGDQDNYHCGTCGEHHLDPLHVAAALVVSTANDVQPGDRIMQLGDVFCLLRVTNVVPSADPAKVCLGLVGGQSVLVSRTTPVEVRR